MAEKLISVEELIREAKKSGVAFGKTDPYNRLRYYTKISLLPHMERRKSRSGDIKAFYPRHALPKLVKIESLKARGLSNEEVFEELRKEEGSIKNVLPKILNKELIYIAVILLLMTVVILNQRGVLSLGKESFQNSEIYQGQESFRVIDSGSYFIKAGKASTFVRTRSVTGLSEIQVAFKNPISPATSYHVETKVPEEGFVLILDDHTAVDAEFSWWITEN